MRSSPARPREEAMPSLQVSVPGQAATSTMVPAPGVGQARCLQLGVERGQIRLAHPAEHEILLDGGADGLLDVLAREVGQRAQLVGGDIAQRQRDRDGRVARLPLLVDVGRVPVRRSPPGAPAPICSSDGGLSGFSSIVAERPSGSRSSADRAAGWRARPAPAA